MNTPTLKSGDLGALKYSDLNELRRDAHRAQRHKAKTEPDYKHKRTKHSARFKAWLGINEQFEAGRREYAWNPIKWDTSDRKYVLDPNRPSSTIGPNVFGRPAYNMAENNGGTAPAIAEFTVVDMEAVRGDEGNVVYVFDKGVAEAAVLAHPARIAAVYGETPDFTYDAQALDIPAIVLLDVAPTNRYVGDVDYFPATINAFCWIIDRPDLTAPGDPVVRMLIIESERPDYGDCGG